MPLGVRARAVVSDPLPEGKFREGGTEGPALPTFLTTVSAGSGAVPSWRWKDGDSLLGSAAGKGQSGTCPKAPLPVPLSHPSWAFCGPRCAFRGASESGQRNGAAGWPLALAWFRVERWGEQLGAGLVMTEQDGLALVTACPAPGSHTWTQQAGPPRQLPAPAIPAWRKARGFHRAVCPLPSLQGLTLHTAVPTRAHMYGARLLGLLEPVAPPLPSSQWSRPPAGDGWALFSFPSNQL